VENAGPSQLVEDLFRREWTHLVAALTRLLGPAHVALAEDLVHDSLLSALQAWQLAPPDDPKAWLLQAAKHGAIDRIRRDRRFEAARPELGSEWTLAQAVELALSPEADAENQLALMFAICDDALSPETHVSLILRLLCGLSAAEIARAFLVDVQTIDRRLHRGRARLEQLTKLGDPRSAAELRARQPSVEQALYLLFNEGYHGASAEAPLQPATCADALRLTELLLSLDADAHPRVHALAALFCFNSARLATRVDAEGVFLPLAEQDRAQWNRDLLERGIRHLGESAVGASWTRWHLEAGIAFEHTRAPSVAETDWQRIVEYYDALLALAPNPVVALNRGLALAELHGLAAGRAALAALADEPKLATYSFFWAGRADIERRAGLSAEARGFYQRAAACARSAAERVGYERRLREAQEP
jgi:RNA polymerase sigma-70 factor (ECF subfamily)